MTKNSIFILFCTFAIQTYAAEPIEPIELIDQELSHFETWVGIPHETVQGLPEGTYQSGNVWNSGEPLGLNNDVKNVFSVIQEDGDLVLKVTGEIYAGLTTKQEFGNYHLSTKFKWGPKKWAPRLDKKLDSGILYHCYGGHGHFWMVWKSSIEYQVMEGDLGDYISLGKNTMSRDEPGPKAEVHRPMPEEEASQLDRPIGEWNLLEIYTVGNNAVHLVNGHVVQVIKNATIHDGVPLTKGQIQFQSEGAECYYKDMRLIPINDFPDAIKALSGL